VNFLEATEILSRFAGGERLPFLLGMSGTPNPLDLYLRAHAAKRGVSAEARTLPFGTLPQTLLQPAAPEEREIFLLFPWDFAPAADWRSGIPLETLDPAELREKAQQVAERLSGRPSARLLYVPAPLPPVYSDPSENAASSGFLTALAISLGARILPAEAFSMASYLASGCPIAGAWLGRVAEAVVEQALPAAFESCKVLVTDLDQVLWAGVIGDDGMEGISYGPEGQGFRHFLYQSLLARLKSDGVLLAAVSRNLAEIGAEPLRSGRMLLSEQDFVSVICSYGAKSAQIAEIARQLNVGLDSFVFVDDNPVELAEVASALPGVHCVTFPSREDGLPEFFARLAQLFARSAVTSEDRERTQMYRRRLQGMVPSSAEGADLTEFLRDLQMTLTLEDRSQGQRERAIQLINKTNQFNLNGVRVSDEEVQRILDSGGRLLTASLADRHGVHGEILSCLITSDRIMKCFVMSCRVFQRRVEHAFLVWLANQAFCPELLDFQQTAKNLSMRELLNDPAFSPAPENYLRFDFTRFAAAHNEALELFTLRVLDGLQTAHIGAGARS
jgi:FkbH-like protein